MDEWARYLYLTARCLRETDREEDADYLVDIFESAFCYGGDLKVRYLMHLARGGAPLPGGLNAATPGSGAGKERAVPNSWADEFAASFVPEDEITIERLDQLFKDAYYVCHLEGDQLYLRVRNINFYLKLFPEHKVIMAAIPVDTDRHPSISELYEFADAVNKDSLDDGVFLRAYLRDGKEFVIDSAFSYAVGVFPCQLVDFVEMMHCKAFEAVRTHGEECVSL
jgi:hypothetical protein